MRTPREVFEDYVGRRKAILRALTQDVDKFFVACDPNKENLCLYGYPDGTWAVDLPAEEVPPEAPEPALGINFARDGMARKDWIGLVAVHSDAWLLALAFYKGARLNRDERDELFSLINKLPTCYEVVSGRVKQASSALPNNPSGALAGALAAAVGGFGSVGGGGAVGVKRPASGPAGGSERERGRGMPSSRLQQQHSDDPDQDDDDGGPGGGSGMGGGGAVPATMGNNWEDGEGDPCPQCGRLYRTEEFWIACDFCDTWYCGRCAKMTEAKAQKMKHWRCLQCAGSTGGQ